MKPEAVQQWMPTLIKAVALVGVGYETLGEDFDRPYLLALFGAMLGIGEVVQAAASRGKEDKDDSDKEEKKEPAK